MAARTKTGHPRTPRWAWLADTRDDRLWWLCLALFAGVVLVLVGHQVCITGQGAGQLIQGTDRDVRCHAVVPHRGELYALLLLASPLLTVLAAWTGRRRLTGAVCLLSVLLLAAYLVYVDAAANYSLAP